jgi:uncharacterized protein
MKVTLDTNVLVAAFISRGHCADLLEYCTHHHEIVSSRHILEELSGVLRRKFDFTAAETHMAVDTLKERILMVQPRHPQKPIRVDPDDVLVLETAHAGHCDCLVTGDAELLALRKYHGIPIIRPADFWRFEKNCS